LALILCLVRTVPKVGQGSNWVRSVTASGAGFGASFLHFLRGLALILCLVRIVPKVGPGSNWVRLATAPGGAHAASPGAGFGASFLYPCADRIRFCAGAAMILSVPFLFSAFRGERLRRMSSWL
jgi:hypothetical protein